MVNRLWKTDDKQPRVDNYRSAGQTLNIDTPTTCSYTELISHNVMQQICQFKYF